MDELDCCDVKRRAVKGGARKAGYIGRHKIVSVKIKGRSTIIQNNNKEQREEAAMIRSQRLNLMT
jgi:hypothetical protein